MAEDDQFEVYFRRADLDGDGRISGHEAVSFFQGANLPKPVLAQIWAIADQARTGFLARPQFFNALRLVTVAQSKRELTPDIVNAALNGPAKARIPPPKINIPTPNSHMPPPPTTAFPPPQHINMPSAPRPNPSHNFPAGGLPQPMPSAPRPNPPYNFPAGPGPGPRPLLAQSQSQSQPMPTGFASRPPQLMPTVTASPAVTNMSNNWLTPSTTSSSAATAGLTNPNTSNNWLSPSTTPSPGATPAVTNPNMSNNWLSSSTTPSPAATPAVTNPNMLNNWLSPSTTPSSGATPAVPNPNTSNNWLSPSTTPSSGATPAVTIPNTSNNWLSPSTTPSSVSTPQTSQQLMPNDSKALAVTGNGFTTSGSTTTSHFGSDAFSATGPATQSARSIPPVKSSSLDSLQSAFSMLPTGGGQIQRTQSLQNASAQQVSPQSSFSVPASGISVGAGISNSASNNAAQPSWPKMKPSDVQKYSKVFMEVDSDRDGRITGEQARNLFLSWRLPREVLKQVWDLSDQDNDSMLSLREFCFALYLMERFREGRPLPETLPSNVMLDETLLSMTGFGQPPGIGPRPMTHAPGLRPPVPSPGLRPPAPGNAPLSEGPSIPNQQKPGAPVLDDSFNNQLVNGEQNGLNFQDAPGEEKKVEKVILDSKEKIEFYRDKMQELVLYRSRCDNRLNEITERAIADKREAESLGKKYEEKYKQVAEIASKLTIEEAKFREIQERKTELHQAILRMEQGGSADGILQVRSDRIQSDLEDLVKALTDRCKKHGLEIKSAAVIELPPGWQPGIQEGAAVWDEDWDKFEDEGFGNELKIDVQNGSVSQKAETVEGEKISPDGSLTPDSLFHEDEKANSFTSPHGHTHENESAFTHSDDELARSPRGSPAGGISSQSPSHDFSDSHFGKSPDAETHRSFDESTWGAFDNNDDTDSVWGFNANTKDSDFDKHKDFFGSSDFGLDPVRTGSPSAESEIFQKKSGFAFDDSVPSTPMSKFGNYSPRYSEAGDHFDSYSRFDSFNDTGFSPQPDNKLTRFDSVNSSKDYGQFSFDDTDPFGSSGQFKVSSDSQKKSSDNWSAF
ncbi:hypothetical protein ACFE04_026043 [Oxalis oulophora]